MAYEMAKYSVSAVYNESLERREFFLLSIGLNFIEWSESAERKRIASERLELARRQLQRTNQKFKAKLLEKVEVLRSENAVLLAQQNLVLAESSYKAKQAELAILTKSEDLFDRSPAFKSLFKNEITRL